MRKSNNVKSFELVERGILRSIVKIKVNEPIKQDIFYYRGIPYIVGSKLKFNGRLFEMELMPIKGETGMHIHEYYNGICYLCGIYKEGEARVEVVAQQQ